MNGVIFPRPMHLLVVSGLLAVSLGWTATGDPPTGPPFDPTADLHGYDGPLALVGVHVLSMENDDIARDQTVVIRDGRVVEVRGGADGSLPSDVRLVEGGGRYLVPGLVDMHVHLRRAHVPDLLRSGVTTVRDMWGHAETAELRKEARSGGVVPSVVATSPGIDGAPPVRPTPAILQRPDEVGPLLQELEAQGWDALKVYQNLDHESFLALAEAASSAGVMLVGHVPTAVPLEDALERMRSIEHLEGYDRALTGHRLRAFRSWTSADVSAMEAWARRTAEAGTWNTPTLTVIRALLRADTSTAMERIRLMVRGLHDAGAPLLAGTDAGVPLVNPGESLHDELSEFVAVGLTPFEALRTATSNPGIFLDPKGEVGTVAEGTRADLLLVESNPLTDLATLRSPTAVVLRGRFLLPGELPEREP